MSLNEESRKDQGINQEKEPAADRADERANAQPGNHPPALSEQDNDASATGAGLVTESRLWYRDKFRQVVTICIVLVGILTVSFIANVVLAVSRPAPVYFAVSDDLRIKRLVPLDEPSISQSALFNWTTRTITRTFSLDFVHWREQLMSVKPEFTEDCFRQLINSLKN